MDDTNVYWVDFLGVLTPPGDAAMKVPLGGGAPVTLATSTGGGTPHRMTIDANNVYWTDGNAVWQVLKAGGAAVEGRRFPGSG